MQHLRYGALKGSDSDENSEPSSPKLQQLRQKTTNSDFEHLFRQVIATNTSEEVQEGINLLVQLTQPLVQFSGKSKTYGVERSAQYKYRTIFSQNTQVNNKLLSLKGNIEELIFSMGYQAIEMGNTSLKPNFYFKHVDTEKFDHLASCISHMTNFLQTLSKVKNNPPKQIDDSEEVSLCDLKEILEDKSQKDHQTITRPLAQISVAPEQSQKPLTLQEMRKKQIPAEKIAVLSAAAVIEESKSEPQQLHIDTQGRADGARIFINKLAFYNSNLPSPLKEHTLSFNQLMYKNLVEQGPINVQTAILNTMVFDPEMLVPLLLAKIPITVFLDRAKTFQGPLVDVEDEINTNFVYQKKAPPGLDWGCFHSKLILYEFDDRLRVVVSSSNLYQHDWHHMSQVIWFQDFYRKSMFPMRQFTEETDFQKYLTAFLQMITPLEANKVFRKQIQLGDFYYSNAQVQLVGSVTGRHIVHDKTKIKLGQSRIKEICNPEDFTSPFFSKQKPMTQRKQIVFQTSSIGSLKPGFLNDMYKAFTSHAPKDVKSQIRILFPTEEHVEDSHLGVAQASSIIMQAKFWDDGILPRDCFCGQKARVKEIEGNLYHAKWIISFDQNQEESGDQQSVVNDQTCIYIGSHNLSQAAWGGYEKNNAQISIANCELGVLFGPKAGSAELKKLILSILPLEVINPAKYNEEIDRPFIMQKQEIYRQQLQQ